jgi:hypothetical protein
MTILRELLENRRTVMKIGANLEMVCLCVNDVKLLGTELLDTLLSDEQQVQGMMLQGIINGPLKIFGMDITSKNKG